MRRIFSRKKKLTFGKGVVERTRQENEAVDISDGIEMKKYGFEGKTCKIQRKIDKTGQHPGSA